MRSMRALVDVNVLAGWFGKVWERTDRLFDLVNPDAMLARPIPLRHPLICPGYSSDFFDDKHFVMKGASWATDRALLRPSFRNWYQARYPYVFAKFRCVRSPSD